MRVVLANIDFARSLLQSIVTPNPSLACAAAAVGVQRDSCPIGAEKLSAVRANSASSNQPVGLQSPTEVERSRQDLAHASAPRPCT